MTFVCVCFSICGPPNLTANGHGFGFPCETVVIDLATPNSTGSPYCLRPHSSLLGGLDNNYDYNKFSIIITRIIIFVIFVHCAFFFKSSSRGFPHGFWYM